MYFAEFPFPYGHTAPKIQIGPGSAVNLKARSTHPKTAIRARARNYREIPCLLIESKNDRRFWVRRRSGWRTSPRIPARFTRRSEKPDVPGGTRPVFLRSTPRSSGVDTSAIGSFPSVFEENVRISSDSDQIDRQKISFFFENMSFFPLHQGLFTLKFHLFGVFFLKCRSSCRLTALRNNCRVIHC